MSAASRCILYFYRPSDRSLGLIPGREGSR